MSKYGGYVITKSSATTQRESEENNQFRTYLELQKYETEIIKINLEMIIVMKVYLFAKIQLTFQKNRSFL